MRILFATEYYHPFTPGGTPWSLQLLARELTRRGHTVAVVTPGYGAPAREDVDGIAVFRFRYWRRLPPGPSLAPVRDHANPLFHLLFARAIARAAREIGADVLHAQEKHALIGTWLAARRLGRPFFLTLRDFGLICPITTCLLSADRIPADCGSVKLQRDCAPVFLRHYIRGGRLRRLRVRLSVALLYLDARLKAAVVRRADGVIGVSRSILDIYTAAGRVPRGRGHVVHSLPPAAPARPPAERTGARARFGLPEGPLVLYVGKLSLGKGFPVLAETARRVTAHRPGTVFAAVGAGPPAADPGPVRLLGSRPHEDVETLYELADVVVHPAVWPEPFSRVPLEAAAASRPVVAARTGGTPEAVEDKETGLLVEPGDAAALADAVERLLADRPLARALGRRAAEVVAERFAADRLVDRLLEVYARMVAGGAR
jgi:glycosyltransferase involved in cell wall biosynthesis